jgi:hypothetical protein
MTVRLYIEKSHFDAFYTWLNQIKSGILTTPTCVFSNVSNDLENPLQVTLHPDEYAMIQDTQEDLDILRKNIGKITSFGEASASEDVRLVKDVIRKSRRYDIEAEVVYTALEVMSEQIDITPGEAMIVAEREWLGN